MSAIKRYFSLEYQIPKYGAYHANPTNVSIHMVFVPLILWTAFLFMANTGPLIASESSLGRLWPTYLPELNLATLVALASIPGYIAMHTQAGLMTVPILLGMVGSATALLHTYGPLANKTAGVLHGLSWIMQFVGHGVFEGRKPALLDNIFQAFYAAPFFVLLEVLFSLGMDPKLHKKLLNLISKEKVRVLAADRAAAQAKAK
ncbi:DUF962 domain-containing protein [Protomyces lactucae-debilis]|uniref:DUF962 domain-containing protein n=1 Tax=Protomyces lactucae-debilis TaxID=2754530 RepID=A0A1Y2EW36_PROLT|nr:DUF962 domain-containing protein [Protomyces lactucae-debilis]ORY75812.1 DUF962 domain-containing protein [Protomyces lactucae-debilis]